MERFDRSPAKRDFLGGTKVASVFDDGAVSIEKDCSRLPDRTTNHFILRS